MTGKEHRGNLVERFRHIVGARHVLTAPAATRRYRRGFRFGEGAALAVVRPGSLVEQWRVLQACVKADVAVIAQASNTGLTGGSTPDGNDYGRDVVIISTTRIRKIHVIDKGQQVICLPGATLDQLERLLLPLGREPHSVIGSSCLGASVFGGICNNSGGALVRRGPAYTELALFAQVDAAGQLKLVNHLGVELGDQAEHMLDRLERQEFSAQEIRYGTGLASDHQYAAHVRDVDADTPARYNADPRRLYEASGSAGKLMLFAVRLDTFAVEQGAKVFHIGTNHPDELTRIRRHALQHFEHLPIAGEYIHRDAFDIAERYGKDTFLAIHYLGASRMPAFFAWKNRIDAALERMRFLPANLTDRIMQAVSHLFPAHLPKRMKTFRDRYAHHLLLKVSAAGVAETRACLEACLAGTDGAWFECTDDEGAKAFLHRFAIAGAAIRYRAVHGRDVEDIVALDVALRRNDRAWVETLPPALDTHMVAKLYYGHFFCHVFHQDYIVKRGSNCLEMEHAIWSLLDARGAQYPAEHSVGHLYPAKPALADFHRRLDPCNCFNPGIGQTSKFRHYRDSGQREMAEADGGGTAGEAAGLK